MFGVFLLLRKENLFDYYLIQLYVLCTSGQVSMLISFTNVHMYIRDSTIGSINNNNVVGSGGHSYTMNTFFMFFHYHSKQSNYLQIHNGYNSLQAGVHAVKSLIFCVVIYRSLFVLSSVVIVLSVLRSMASNYSFGIFKLFSCIKMSFVASWDDSVPIWVFLNHTRKFD